MGRRGKSGRDRKRPNWDRNQGDPVFFCIRPSGFDSVTLCPQTPHASCSADTGEDIPVSQTQAPGHTAGLAAAVCQPCPLGLRLAPHSWFGLTVSKKGDRLY